MDKSNEQNSKADDHTKVETGRTVTFITDDGTKVKSEIDYEDEADNEEEANRTAEEIKKDKIHEQELLEHRSRVFRRLRALPEGHPGLKVKTSDSEADLYPDKAGFNCCHLYKYRISPQFSGRKFQNRFIIIVLACVLITYIPALLTLGILIFHDNFRWKVLKYVCTHSEFVIVFFAVLIIYYLITWYAPLARYNPYLGILLFCRSLLVATFCFTCSALTDVLFIVKIEDMYNPNNLSLQHATGYWPLLMLLFAIYLHVFIAIILKVKNVYICNKALVYFIFMNFVTATILSQMFVMFAGIGRGPMYSNHIQTTLASLLAMLLTKNTLNSFDRAFRGNLCPLTEYEYFWCALRVGL